MRLYERQNLGLRDLKHKLLAALDRTATGKITQPLVGTMRITILEALTALKTEYSGMTDMQLQTIYRSLQTQKWDPSEDLCDFMETFRAQVEFLAEHDYAPPRGEQARMLADAVKDVVQFSAMATPAFHAAHPVTANQTLARLIAVYTTVYRGQYDHVTARQYHHAANQAKQEDPQDDMMEGIMASVRGSLAGVTLTFAQKKAVHAAVARAVEEALINERPGNKPRAPTRSVVPAPAGACTNPAHRSTYVMHLEKDCRMNPKSANYTGNK
jgi:hypothetical protein